MISAPDMAAITSATGSYWEREVREDWFRTIARGREVGHRICTVVQEKTVELLGGVSIPTRTQSDSRGRELARSMGDVWANSCGIWNPINVKSGVVGVNGKPNVVSIRKLLTALMNRQIDSYYVLSMKISTNGADQVESHVYMTDILEHLDCISFDSGTGQLRLLESQFYPRMETIGLAAYSYRSGLSVGQKAEYLNGMLDDAVRRLIENRERVRDDMARTVKEFVLDDDLPVTQLSQIGLGLG